MDDSPSDTAVELPSDPDETLDALTFLSVQYHRLPLFFEIKACEISFQAFLLRFLCASHHLLRNIF